MFNSQKKMEWKKKRNFIETRGSIRKNVKYRIPNYDDSIRLAEPKKKKEETKKKIFNSKFKKLCLHSNIYKFIDGIIESG